MVYGYVLPPRFSLWHLPHFFATVFSSSQLVNSDSSDLLAALATFSLVFNEELGCPLGGPLLLSNRILDSSSNVK
jgi:hypothetical protein